MNNKVIKKVLMCKPLYFSLLSESYNPWMRPGTIDGKKAVMQWTNLVNIYKKLKIAVEVIEPKKDVPDMVFAADQGVVKKKKILLSRFRLKPRQAESKYYEDWFDKKGYDVVRL